MAKATITYIGNAEGVRAYGHDFAKPLEADDEAVITKATNNRFFKVTGGKADAKQPLAKVEKVTPRDRGAEAKATGKERKVPPAYRGKPAEAEWLSGYDTPANVESGIYPAGGE